MLETLFNNEAAQSAWNFATSETIKFVFSGVLGASVYGLYNRYKTRQNFNKAVSGQRVSPEIQMTLLQWKKHDNPDGPDFYDLDSTTKHIDLRMILPEQFKEELPKYVVAASKKTTPESPLIFDHILEATQDYDTLFKSKEHREQYAKKAVKILQSQIKYMVPRQWCGEDVLQQAYEGGADAKETFYSVLVHEKQDEWEELRLLVIPESYLEEDLPKPDEVRVRGKGRAVNDNMPDLQQTHPHTQRLVMLRSIVDRLKKDYDMREQSLVRIPKPMHRLDNFPHQRDETAPSAVDLS
ncbi:MAG: hypothetical protein ACLFR0_00915 [Alphaproteobacteria bacterium]